MWGFNCARSLGGIIKLAAGIQVVSFPLGRLPADFPLLPLGGMPRMSDEGWELCDDCLPAVTDVGWLGSSSHLGRPSSQVSG